MILNMSDVDIKSATFVSKLRGFFLVKSDDSQANTFVVLQYIWTYIRNILLSSCLSFTLCFLVQ